MLLSFYCWVGSFGEICNVSRTSAGVLRDYDLADWKRLLVELAIEGSAIGVLLRP